MYPGQPRQRIKGVYGYCVFDDVLVCKCNVCGSVCIYFGVCVFCVRA